MVSTPTNTGWWFGTMEFYDFPYIGNFITPTDELIFFQRGRYTTNASSRTFSGRTWGMMTRGLAVPSQTVAMDPQGFNGRSSPSKYEDT